MKRIYFGKFIGLAICSLAVCAPALAQGTFRVMFVGQGLPYAEPTQIGSEQKMVGGG
jgi:hypothetical protein